ncbi:unnamed protein product, partial [Mesorhabditis spiculigera]
MAMQKYCLVVLSLAVLPSISSGANTTETTKASTAASSAVVTSTVGATGTTAKAGSTAAVTGSTAASATSGTTMRSCVEQYSPWMTRGVCNDTCGGYGQMQLVRACLTGCTCEGPFQMQIRCAQALCEFPRATCDTSVGLAKYLFGTNWYCGFGNGI